MNKSLDLYDDMPSGMKAYISNYGFHFSKKANDYAVGLMKKDVNGVSKSIKPITREMLDDMLAMYDVKVERNKLYDYVYVANMCKADYLGSSITDEKSLCLFVKDYIDDVDASDETAFRRWLATMVGNGEPIEWDDLL